MRDIDMYNVRKKDGTVVNEAAGLNSDGSRNVTLTGSNAVDGIVVVPNDATSFSATKGLYVGVSGDVKVTLKNGTTITFGGLAAGVIHPISATKVYATGTTALSIVGVY